MLNKNTLGVKKYEANIIQGVNSIFDKVASRPQLISYLLVAPACLHAVSDWPRTFLHPRCFCLV